MSTAVAAASPDRVSARQNVLVSLFTKLVGPAALTAAGMIGAGAVATRLLAGAWFGFNSRLPAARISPMPIITLDLGVLIGLCPSRGALHRRSAATSASGWRG